MKPLRLTVHASVVVANRRIERAWIERAVRAPDRVEPEPRDPTLKRAFAAVPERSGRTLRVVYGETASEYVIVTAFFDRDAGQGRRDGA